MAGIVKWVRENPVYAALLGFVLTWMLRESVTKYIPEDMEPVGGKKAQAVKPKTIRRRTPAAGRPGELSGEFKELLEEPPAM